MKFLYRIGIFFYSVLIKTVSFFNKKAKSRIKGVKKTFETLESFKSEKTIWFHCASLGEFEQGRPLIEKIKQKYPDKKIALSFFSPSGYEIRKNYPLADVVFYLPDDTEKNAEKLIEMLNPEYVFFIKYEFWHFYINRLRQKNISVFLVSGIFRKNQIFFKPYGEFFLNIIKKFSRIFVQNKESFDLLEKSGIKNIIVSGDTRFDRVYQNAVTKKNFKEIENFIEGKFTVVAGSTYKEDEKLILKLSEDFDIKIIIAPHEIKNENIERIIKNSPVKTVRYSRIKGNETFDADVMIIDNIGMLSSLYAYADIAYTGGGFGKGIHNTLEAAVFGIPVIFGTKYDKFDEAKELIKRKAGFSVSGYKELFELTKKFFENADELKKTGNEAYEYVKENIGASDKILSEINL